MAAVSQGIVPMHKTIGSAPAAAHTVAASSLFGAIWSFAFVLTLKTCFDAMDDLATKAQ